MSTDILNSIANLEQKTEQLKLDILKIEEEIKEVNLSNQMDIINLSKQIQAEEEVKHLENNKNNEVMQNTFKTEEITAEQIQTQLKNSFQI